MSKIVFYISLFLLAIVPLPIFLDISTGQLVLQAESFPEASAPVPVGLFGLAAVFSLYFMMSLVPGSRFNRFVGNSVSVVGGAVFLFLILWALFLSEADFLRVIQVYLPLLFVLMIAYPSGQVERRLIYYVPALSFLLFCSLHFLSLVIYSEDWVRVTVFEFPMFFGLGIYQSLVTYTAVATLYLIVALVGAASPRPSFVMRIGLMIGAVVIFYVLAMGGRRASLVEIIIISGVAVIIAFFYILTKLKLSRSAVIAFLAVAPFIFFYDKIMSFPIFERSVATYQRGAFDGGRFEIYSRAVSELRSDYVLLFAGRGGASGYHNFFLDLIYSIGLVPLLMFLSTLIYVAFSGVRRLYVGRQVKDWLPVFMFVAIFACLAVQSMVNASITQPYYFINLIVILLLACFYPQWGAHVDRDRSCI